MHCAKCYFYESDVGDEVCNRCGRAYMPEANIYLGLILMAAGGMAWTLRHLLTGDTDPFTRPQVDLGAWATWPVSIVDIPAYGFVIGGWMGMLAVTPILTGLLYGKRGGWLLVIVMAALGPSVAMMAAVALGVWIAAGYTTRLGSKLASALLGLVPVAIYWVAATALTDFSKGESPPVPGLGELAAAVPVGRTLAPALSGLAWIPPITAVVVAAAVSALVVAIGWADRWHVRWPGALVTVMTVGPMLSLLAFVGIDEVRYGMFLQPSPVAGPAPVDERSEIALCQEFLARHPDAPRAAQVRARLAESIEKIEQGALPSAKMRPSDEVWTELLKLEPTSPWAADAHLHLGNADARQGLFDLAAQHYRSALARTAAFEAPKEDPLARFSVVWNLFSIGRDLRAREDAERLENIRGDVLARLAILADNRTGAQDNSRALALYFAAMQLKGTNRYREALLAARDADPKGALADNIAYDLAMFEADDKKRIDLLREVITAWPGADGAMLAHLKAAQALMARAAADPGAMREAQQHLTNVQANLEARKARCPADPYVMALADRVEKELVYVQAQLRRPDAGH